MPPVATDALVLRTYKLGETSTIAVLLTRDRGKVRAVARGARGRRNRYRSALEPLSEVRAGLYGRQGAELFRLGECELIRTAFAAGAERLEYGLLLGYFAELLEGFVQEGEADDAVYRLAVAAVRALEDGRSGVLMARYLEAWLLKLHGIYPPLRRCATCDGPLEAGELRYADESHGFVCRNCPGAIGTRLSLESRELLERIFRTAPAEMDGPAPAGIETLEPFHVDLIQRHFERELRSRRVLRSVERGLSR